MSMALKIVTPPATTPVSLVDAKKHLRVDFPDDDDLIKAYVAAATQYVDGPRGFLGRALIDQTWDYFVDSPPLVGFWDCASPLPLPLPPLIEVVEVYTIDANGAETEWPPENYRVDAASEPARIIPLKGWPTPFYYQYSPRPMMRVRFRAGYLAPPSDPPPDPPTTFNYNYAAQGNQPPSGQCNQSQSSPEQISFSYTDADSNDNTAFLSGLGEGDQISANGVTWTVENATFRGSNVLFTVAPAVIAPPQGVLTAFSFGAVPAALTTLPAVPAPIKAAILLHVGDLYRTRETTVLGERMLQLPWAAEQLLRPHRFYMSLG
jgi:uncharacterized phiE125 gp8 family phage protein